MTFVLCSKRDNLGTHGNWQSLHNYFELGWEMGATLIDCKHLIASGQIKPETHTVVTLRDRMFLYSSLMPVMAFEDFAIQRNIRDASRIQFPDVLDLTQTYARTSWIDTNVYHGNGGRYIHTDLVKPLYDEFTHPDVSGLAAEPFYLCCWRYRHNHSSDRNTPAATAMAFHSHLTRKGAKVYVVGLDTQHLCDGKTSLQVDLPTFCALAKHPNCLAVTGAMTGTMQFAAVICRSVVAVYQHNDKVPEANEVNHPVVFGECVNFHNNKRLLRYEPRTPIQTFFGELDALTGHAE